jgi:hypothetical protein
MHSRFVVWTRLHLPKLRFHALLRTDVRSVFPSYSPPYRTVFCRILSFVPDIVFIVVAVFRLWFLYHQSNKLQSAGWPLLSAKIASGLLLMAVNMASLNYLLDVQRREVLFVWLAAPATQLASTVSIVLLYYS